MGKEESRWQVPVPGIFYKLIKKMGTSGAIPEIPIL